MHIQHHGENFSKLRSFFWPVYRRELNQLVPLFALYFLIAFVYHVLRCVKITLIVNAPDSGAHIIPYLKFWAVLPSAFCFTYVYTKLNQKLNIFNIISLVTVFFFAYFLIFCLFIFPQIDQWSIDAGHPVIRWFPDSLRGMSLMLQHWHLTSFYVMSEMWSTMMLSILFWVITNEVIQFNQAKRFYALIAMGANVAGIFSGELMRLLSVEQAWDKTFYLLMLPTLIAIALILVVFHGYRVLVVSKLSPSQKQVEKTKLDAKQAGFGTAIKLLIHHPYLKYIAMIVLCYNMIFHFADVLWTDQLHQRFSDPVALNAFLARMDSLTGLLSMLGSFLVFSNMMRLFGWTKTALISPIIWLLTSIAVMSLLIGEHSRLIDVLILFKAPMAQLILVFGALQICLGRACKFTIIDQTKEMAYIPLSLVEKRNGKAVIDGLLSRFGKSGSALCLQVLMLFSAGQLSPVLPLIGCLLIGLIVIWIHATKQVGRHLPDAEAKASTQCVSANSSIKAIKASTPSSGMAL